MYFCFKYFTNKKVCFFSDIGQSVNCTKSEKNTLFHHWQKQNPNSSCLFLNLNFNWILTRPHWIKFCLGLPFCIMFQCSFMQHLLCFFACLYCLLKFFIETKMICLFLKYNLCTVGAPCGDKSNLLQMTACWHVCCQASRKRFGEPFLGDLAGLNSYDLFIYLFNR